MNHAVTLQGHDGSTTIIPFDSTITIATLIKQYREQTGYGGVMELFYSDDTELFDMNEQPVEHTVVVRSKQTLFVQKMK